MIVEDEVAQKLETAGLWRRAASRWLDVMQRYALTVEQRDWIRHRRKYCLSRAKPVSTPEKLDVAEILRAAKATQERMGLSQPGGEAFRLKDQNKMNSPGVRSGHSPTVDDVISGSDLIENDMLITLHGIDIQSENTGEASS
jgi:PerC transcriptional activator.